MLIAEIGGNKRILCFRLLLHQEVNTQRQIIRPDVENIASHGIVGRNNQISYQPTFHHLFRFDMFPPEKQVARVEKQEIGGFFPHPTKIGRTLGQTATRIFMSTTGDDGTPFISRIKDMQSFPPAFRPEAAG